MRALALVPAALLGAAGCTPERSLEALEPGGVEVFTQRFENDVDYELDLLFVIDSSGSMAQEQDGLARAFPRFVRRIDAIDSLSWRIGITTTDLGGFGYPVPGCTTAGQGGALLDGGAAPTCAGFEGRWLWHEDGKTNAAGGRISDAFACVARVGTSGCPYEMPLGAVVRALGGGPAGPLPENAGFLRERSIVAVVIVTDEDDCTAVDPAFLDPNDPSFGPMTSFRCTANGVVCDDPADLLAIGEHRGCRPGGPRELDPTALAAFLQGLRPGEPDKVMLAIIAGPAEPFAIGSDSAGRRTLLPSCESDFGAAAPGVRLAAAVEAMGSGGLHVPLCDGDLRPAVDAIGNLIVERFTSHCISGAPADAQPDEPGLQADCTVTADGEPVPRCGGGGPPGACFQVLEDPACASGYALSTGGASVEISCRTAP